MQRVSDAFLACTRRGGTRITVADVTANGETVTSLPVSAGDIGVDISDAVRRDLSCEIAAMIGDGISVDIAALLATPGAEITVRSGWVIDGQAETVPCGVFRVAPSRDDHGCGVTLSVDGLDRSSIVQRPSVRPVSVPAELDTVEAIKQLVRVRYPNATFATGATTYQTTALYWDANSDLWDAARRLADGIGLTLGVDPTGVFSLMPTPTLSSPVDLVFSTRDDPDTWPMWDAHQDAVPFEEVYNGVIVTGSHSSLPAPVRGEAWITDPASPLRRNGPLGENAKFVDSNSISTASQAELAARAKLNNLLGDAEAVTFSTVPNAALDVGDVVQVDNPAVTGPAKWIVSQITLPLTVGDAMSVTCRQTIEDPSD